MSSYRIYINLGRIYLRIIASKWILMSINILCTVLTILTISIYVKGINAPSLTISQAIVVFSIIFIGAFIATIPSIFKSYNIKGIEGVRIQLLFGDILNSKMDIVIPTNTSFDTDWSCIKATSIQGQFCNRFYKGLDKYLGAKLNELLSNMYLTEIELTNKRVGNKTRYPINTIVPLKRGESAESQVFYWIAINDHDDAGNVPLDTICITRSVSELWDYLRRNRKVRSIAIPILGTGLSGVNQSSFDVFEYIVDSFIVMSLKHKIADTLRIYIYPKDYMSFQDFELANQYLRFRCEHPFNIESKCVF